MDRHYTPKAFAESIVNSLPNLNPGEAADFAVGGASLLEAVRRRWPQCKLVATDIDRSALLRIKRKLARISSGVCDFFNERSRNRSPVLAGKKGKIPFIFLNPPFS